MATIIVAAAATVAIDDIVVAISVDVACQHFLICFYFVLFSLLFTQSLGLGFLFGMFLFCFYFILLVFFILNVVLVVVCLLFSLLHAFLTSHFKFYIHSFTYTLILIVRFRDGNRIESRTELGGYLN